MGNCTATRLVNGQEDAFDLCRERKRLLRSSVDRRHILADAHFNYVLSLRSVAAAINLFIARHGSSSNPSPPPLLLQQTQTQPKTQTLPPIAASSSSSSTSTSSTTSTSSCSTNAKEIRCGYFYSSLPTIPVSPINDFGWDFFNPFDGVRAVKEAAMLVNLCRSSDEDLRVVREEEGIPDLEEAEGEEIEERGERKTELCNGGERKLEEEEEGEVRERGLMVTEKTEKEWELLEALRDIEDQFIRAFDCGKEVSKMLEVNNNINRVDDHLQTFHFDEVKENSSKLIQAITWHRSPSSQSSSRRSYSASSSKDTLLIERKSDFFDDCGGMESGSHSQTIGRLYALGKKAL